MHEKDVDEDVGSCEKYKPHFVGKLTRETKQGEEKVAKLSCKVRKKKKSVSNIQS